MSLMDVGNIQLFSWRNTGPHLTVQWSSVWAVWVLKYNHNHTPRCLVLLSPVFLLWFCIEIPLYYYVLHYTAQPQSCMENGKHSLFCTLPPCNTRQLKWKMFRFEISSILYWNWCIAGLSAPWREETEWWRGVRGNCQYFQMGLCRSLQWIMQGLLQLQI